MLTPLPPPHRSPVRRGSSPLAVVFSLFGVALLFGPFLRNASTADDESDDWGRLASEIDIPFGEDALAFDEEYELGLQEAVAAASEEYFGLDAEPLREAAILDLARVEGGSTTYARHCVGCHGVSGNGAGPAARHLAPRPRNFRRGFFKFTSTDTGKRPRVRDLFNTITRGLAGSSMPNFRLLSEELRWDAAEYVRYLSMRGEFEQLFLDLAWEDEELPDPEEVAEIVFDRWAPESTRPVYPGAQEPTADESTIAAGRALYLDPARANCTACHGDGGRGDGPSATAFADSWGYPIAPRDLTTGVYRAGDTAADIYRTIASGIGGTPMPSFGGTLEPNEIWQIVHFIQSLAESR